MQRVKLGTLIDTNDWNDWQQNVSLSDLLLLERRQAYTDSRRGCSLTEVLWIGVY